MIGNKLTFSLAKNINKYKSKTRFLTLQSDNTSQSEFHNPVETQTKNKAIPLRPSKPEY